MKKFAYALFITAFLSFTHHLIAEKTQPSLEQQLLIAAYNGSHETVATCIKQGARIENPDRDGNTALHHAAHNGHEAIVKILLMHGANVEAKNNKNQTAIELAAENKQNEMVEYLRGFCADYYVCEGEKKSIAHIAAAQKNPDLLNSFACDSYLCNLLATSDRLSPLHIAVQTNNPENVQILIENNADINILNHKGHSPVVLASSTENIEIIQQFEQHHDFKVNRVNHKGQTNLMVQIEACNTKAVKRLLENPDLDTTRKDITGHTALHYAAHFGHHDGVLALINKNRSLLTITNHSGLIPLQTAIHNKKEKAASILYAHSPQNIVDPANGQTVLHDAIEHEIYTFAESILTKETVNKKNNNGNTPVILAICKSAHNKNINALVKKMITELDADLALTNNQGRNALHIASANNNDELFEICLQYDLVDTQDNQGNTPLHIATSHNVFYNTQALLQAKAQPNARNNKNEVPLFGATRNNNTELIDLLYAYKATIDATDTDGYTSLMYAFAKGFSEARDILCKKGANLNHRSNNGNTTYHEAAGADNKDNLEFLLAQNPQGFMVQNKKDETPFKRAISAKKLANVIYLQDHIEPLTTQFVQDHIAYAHFCSSHDIKEYLEEFDRKRTEETDAIIETYANAQRLLNSNLISMATLRLKHVSEHTIGYTAIARALPYTKDQLILQSPEFRAEQLKQAKKYADHEYVTKQRFMQYLNDIEKAEKKVVAECNEILAVQRDIDQLKLSNQEMFTALQQIQPSPHGLRRTPQVQRSSTSEVGSRRTGNGQTLQNITYHPSHFLSYTLDTLKNKSSHDRGIILNQLHSYKNNENEAATKLSQCLAAIAEQAHKEAIDKAHNKAMACNQILNVQKAVKELLKKNLDIYKILSPHDKTIEYKQSTCKLDYTEEKLKIYDTKELNSILTTLLKAQTYENSKHTRLEAKSKAQHAQLTKEAQFIKEKENCDKQNAEIIQESLAKINKNASAPPAESDDMRSAKPAPAQETPAENTAKSTEKTENKMETSAENAVTSDEADDKCCICFEDAVALYPLPCNDCKKGTTRICGGACPTQLKECPTCRGPLNNK